ncbi:MAG: hypothetical protein IJ996_02530 [Clostridia bacterium]|nr:hypothetical protein [Clostridia bacterium]
MNGEKKKDEEFKEQCQRYLEGLSLMDLRCYGRFLNLPAPTNCKKAELIDEIVAVLSKECQPTRNKRGAPIKNTYFSENILLEIENIRERVYDKEKELDKGNEGDEEKGVTLQFSIRMDILNTIQKKLLNDFLNSL